MICFCEFGSLAKSNIKSFNTVVVLPVPGPPQITENSDIAEDAAATFCQLTLSELSGKRISKAFFRYSSSSLPCAVKA